MPYEGDSWKHVKETVRVIPFSEQLRDINRDFAFEIIDRDEWSARFDQLVEPNAELCRQR